MFRISIFLIICIIYTSCSTPHISMQSLEQCAFPIISTNDTLNLGYFDKILEKTENKRASKWAKHNHFHLYGIQLINNSDKIIHGSELEFYNENKKLELISNRWAAKKLRQRINPVPFIGFFTSLIEAIIYNKIDPERNDDMYPLNENAAIDHTISGEIVSISEDIRKTANNNFINEMIKYDITRQSLYSNKANYGIIVIKSDKAPEKIQVKVIDIKNIKIGENKLAPK